MKFNSIISGFNRELDPPVSDSAPKKSIVISGLPYGPQLFEFCLGTRIVIAYIFVSNE